jgi:hypothetical protein
LYLTSGVVLNAFPRYAFARIRYGSLCGQGKTDSKVNRAAFFHGILQKNFRD